MAHETPESVEKNTPDTSSVDPDRLRKMLKATAEKDSTLPQAEQRGEDKKPVEDINYFEEHFGKLKSIDALKGYIRSSGETSPDGVLELEDTYGNTRIQYGELLGAINRFTGGEGTLEAIPGKKLRAAIANIKQ